MGWLEHRSIPALHARFRQRVLLEFGSAANHHCFDPKIRIPHCDTTLSQRNGVKDAAVPREVEDRVGDEPSIDVFIGVSDRVFFLNIEE